MTDRERALRGLQAAHRALELRLQQLTDAQARAASLLPGWSVGHVLTHLARNADGLRRMLDGAARGESAEMYPGGFEARTADIEAGAGRTAEALVDDVRMAAARLELSFDSLPEAGWAGHGITVFGPVAIEDLPFRRWREVEVHHADLGLGYGWRDWPADYVRAELRVLGMLWDSRRPMGLTGLPPEARAVDDHERAAWLLGRTEIAGLPAAGLLG